MFVVVTLDKGQESWMIAARALRFFITQTNALIATLQLELSIVESMRHVQIQTAVINAFAKSDMNSIPIILIRHVSTVMNVQVIPIFVEQFFTKELIQRLKLTFSVFVSIMMEVITVNAQMAMSILITCSMHAKILTSVSTIQNRLYSWSILYSL